MKRSITTLAAAFAATLLLAPGLAPQAAGEAPRPDRLALPADQRITEDLATVLHGYAFTTVYDWVEGAVDGGVVTVGGSVLEPWHRDALIARVKRIPGVEQVVDQIRVLPVSIFDDRLRSAARRALFGDEFRQWAALGNPPIHVVVERGVITLYGEVPSLVEARIATSLVRTKTPALKVIDRLRIASSVRG